MLIIYEGTEEEFWNKLKVLIKEVIEENDAKKVAPLSMTEAGRQLGLNYRTVKKIMDEMKLTEIFPGDIDKILFKYPKYIKKSVRG